MKDTPPDEFLDEPVETGITAAVTPAVARVMLHLPDLSPVDLARLARDIAYDYHDLGAILLKHKLSQAQYDYLLEHNEFFKNTLQDLVKEFHAIGSTQDRIKLHAAAALEELLPQIASRMASRTEDLKDVIEGAKIVAKIAGVDQPDRAPPQMGEKFQIIIDLGADRVTIEATPPVIEGTKNE